MANNLWKRFLLPLLVALALVAAGCSDDDDSSADDTSDEAADSADDAGETDDDAGETDDDAGETDDASEGDGPVAVDLGEWFIDTPAEFAAGSITFSVGNSGENPHAFAIVRGTSYEDLPLKDNGAVDIDAVGDDFLGTTDNLETGDAADITFDLESGQYVFFCPIEFGPNSHAAAGQVLSVTVG